MLLNKQACRIELTKIASKKVHWSYERQVKIYGDISGTNFIICRDIMSCNSSSRKAFRQNHVLTVQWCCIKRSKVNSSIMSWSNFLFIFLYLYAGVPKQGGMGEIYPPNNLAVSPPIIWMGVHLSKNWGKKCSIFDEDLFIWSSPEFWEKKVFYFWWRPFFFWSSPNFHTWTKSWSRFIPSNVKNSAKLG